jgi:uncharacterized protein YndB with AHSA1/START domain
VIRVERRVDADPAAVWAVLSDGWTYPGWVVGASRIRAVESGFPKPGTRLHHSVGAWPLLIHDSTRVIECEPEERLVLGARAWPLGEAVIDLRVRPDGNGQSVVTMLEDASSGPGRLAPRRLRAAGLVPRNRESLRRLAHLAERRTLP